MCVISELGRLRQEKQKFKASWMHGDSEASLVFRVRLCLNQKSKKLKYTKYTHTYTDTDTYMDIYTHGHIHRHMEKL